MADAVPAFLCSKRHCCKSSGMSWAMTSFALRTRYWTLRAALP